MIEAQYFSILANINNQVEPIPPHLIAEKLKNYLYYPGDQVEIVQVDSKEKVDILAKSLGVSSENLELKVNNRSNLNPISVDKYISDLKKEQRYEIVNFLMRLHKIELNIFYSQNLEHKKPRNFVGIDCEWRLSRSLKEGADLLQVNKHFNLFLIIKFFNFFCY